MPDTLQNIKLPKNTYIDLYAGSGIAVGTKINVQNVGSSEVRLTVKATEPTNTDGFLLLERSDQAANETNDSGAWAVSVYSDGSVNVSESA